LAACLLALPEDYNNAPKTAIRDTHSLAVYIYHSVFEVIYMCAIFEWRILGAFVAQNAVFHANMMCPDASILMLKHAIEGSGLRGWCATRNSAPCCR